MRSLAINGGVSPPASPPAIFATTPKNCIEMKTLTRILLLLIIVDSVFFLYTFSFRLAAFNENFHKREFSRLGVYEGLKGYGIDNNSIDNIDNINRQTLDYLQGKSAVLPDFYNERESSHLADVKMLVSRVKGIFYLSISIMLLLLFSIFLLDRKKFKKNIGIACFWAGIGSLAIALLLYTAARTNFNAAFEVFHKILFKPGSYLFDTRIVALYPPEFFYSIGVNIMAHVTIAAVFLIGAGIYLYKK